MTTVSELIEALQKIDEPSTTGIFFTEVNKDGEIVKEYTTSVIINGLNLLKKDICMHKNKCECVNTDMVLIDFIA